VHSDDPAYFGGYVGDNYAGVAAHLGFGAEMLARIARNSFVASFLDPGRRGQLLQEVDDHLDASTPAGSA